VICQNAPFVKTSNDLKGHFSCLKAFRVQCFVK